MGKTKHGRKLNETGNIMKVAHPKKDEMQTFDEAVSMLRELSYKTAVTRGKLALAGEKTFMTRSECTFLRRLENRINRIQEKLEKRAFYARRNVPELVGTQETESGTVEAAS